MKMTLEQVNACIDTFKVADLNVARQAVLSLAESYAAHLARQSEVVSDDAVLAARYALMGHSGYDPGDSGYVTDDAVRAALTAVWHNRPAQEKADPVATVASVRAELVKKIGDGCQGGDPLCAGGCLAEIAAKRNAERTFPPAERVRVPDGWIDRHQIAAGGCPPQSMVILVSSIRRMLSAAPEADHG